MQMSLDITARKHGGNDCSNEAHEKAAPRSAWDKARILELLAKPEHRAGLTREQIEELLGLLTPTASARVSELKRDGFVVTTGERRPTRSGCTASVLILAK